MRKTHLLLTLAATLIVGGSLASCGEKTNVNEVKDPIVENEKEEQATSEIGLIDCELIKVPTGAYSSDIYYNGEYKDLEGNYLTKYVVGTRMLENLSAYLYKQAIGDGTLNEATLKDILSFDYVAYHTNVNNYGTSAVVYDEFIENAGKGLEAKFVEDEKEEAKLDEFYFTYKDLRAPTGAYSSDAYYEDDRHPTLSTKIYVQMLENLNEYLITTLVEGKEVDQTKVKEILSTKFIAYHTNVNNWGINSSAYYKFIKGVIAE